MINKTSLLGAMLAAFASSLRFPESAKPTTKGALSIGAPLAVPGSYGFMHISRPMGYVRMPNQRQRRKLARQIQVALPR